VPELNDSEIAVAELSSGELCLLSPLPVTMTIMVMTTTTRSPAVGEIADCTFQLFRHLCLTMYCEAANQPWSAC